jgi:hypothetical protein
LPVLDAIEKRKAKYKKIVMTTNAIKLFDFVGRVNEVVDHVNISRHHWLQEENEKVFKTKNIPDDVALSVYADKLKNKLTFNCVIKNMSVEDMHVYLKYAKALGINNVCFRQEHGNLNSVEIERYLLLNHAKTGEGGCPVCRSSYFDFEGMSVGIKYSILEPNDVIDGIYELILHSDGKLTSDWEAKVEVKLEKEELNHAA